MLFPSSEPLVVSSLSCPTLCDPIDCNPPDSSVHGIFQAGILEWVAISFSRGSSRPRDRTHISCTGKWFLYYTATREAPRPTPPWKLALMNNIFLLSKDFETKSSLFNFFPPLASLSWGINLKWIYEFLLGVIGVSGSRKPVNIWTISCYT